MDFKELIRTHFRVEIQAEDLRQKLECNPVFNLSNAFEICDVNNTGEITHDEIRHLISTRGFFVSDKDAMSLIDKFDKSKRGSITK